MVSSEFHLPRARALFEYILNRLEVDNGVQVLVSPVLVYDPKIKSTLKEKTGKSFKEIQKDTNFIETNMFNNLERVYWEKEILTNAFNNWNNFEDLKNKAEENLGVVEKTFKNRWPDEKLTT